MVVNTQLKEVLKVYTGEAEMLKNVRAFVALVLVARTHILVPNVCKSSSGGFNTLFGLPKVLHIYG